MEMDVEKLVGEMIEEMPAWVKEQVRWWSKENRNRVYRYIEELLKPEQPQGIALARKTMEHTIERNTQFERLTGIREIKKMVWGELNSIWPSEERDLLNVSINGIELRAYDHLWCALPAVVVKAIEPDKKIYTLYMEKKGYTDPVMEIFYPLTLEQLSYIYEDTLKCLAKLVEIKNATCDMAVTEKCLEPVCEHASHLIHSLWEHLLPNMVTGQNYPDCITIIGYSAGITDAIRENCPPDKPEIQELLKTISSGYMADKIQEVLRLAREEGF